jgi:acetyl-CoA carboxylase beta subunit
MSWVSFIIGGMTVLIAYAMFSFIDKEEMELERNTSERNQLIVNHSTGRYVTFSCQTCRKLKRHKEIETNVYQCTKCKGYFDLRRL